MFNNISSEVILANLLYYNSAIDISYIYLFKNEFLTRVESKNFFYFDISNDSINEALYYYNDIFKRSQNIIYKLKDYLLDYFNKKYSENLKKALKESAYAVLKEKKLL